MNIYIGDLKHNFGPRDKVVPLGIATLASALHDHYGKKISTKLFVSPNKLITELKSNLPDVIALSNYMWNSRLSLRILRLAKEIKPDILTIMGGPHARYDQEGLKNLLLQNSFLDAYIPFQGEIPFADLVGKCLSKKSNNKNILANVPGVYFNIEGYKFKQAIYESDKGKNHKYNSPSKTINKYTSPYLNGMLDEFLEDTEMSPMLESNRGCPYQCTFCAWGAATGPKLIKKNLDRFLSELWYVGKRSKKDIWFLTDGNFGIVKEDVIIAENFKEINRKYGYPKQVHYNTAKHQAKRVYEISDILGELTQVNIAVQSFDSDVNKKIKRRNLPNEQISEFIAKHQNKGRIVTTDLLVPNSGETLKSHLNSIRTFFDLGFDSVATQIIRLLPGTEMESDESRKKYGVKTKWRLTDCGWGEYENEFIYEIDENIMSTNDISEEEMHFIKKIHFLIAVCWTYGAGKPLLKFASRNRINPLDIIIDIIKDKKSLFSQKILIPLETEFSNEWFDSKEELIRYYSNNSAEVKNFKKLNLKYLTKLVLEKDLMSELIKNINKYVCKKSKLNEQMINTVTQISIDSLRLDILNDKINKSDHYKIEHKYFNYLKSIKIIPKDIKYIKDGFVLNYVFPKERFMRMKSRITENNYYSENPAEGIYHTLVSNAFWFFYKIITKKYSNRTTNNLVLTT